MSLTTVTLDRQPARVSLRWRKLWRTRERIDFDKSIKNVVIVAGVSGSGKSTFIKHLQSASLPAAIAAHLPADVSDWQFVGGRAPTRGGRPGARPSGQILHYEITAAFNGLPACNGSVIGQFSACEDIRLMHRLMGAEKIHLVVIGAPPDQIARQLACRSVLLHVPSPLRPLLARVAGALHRADVRIQGPARVLARFLGRRWRHRSAIRERNNRLIELYRRPGAVDEIYADWTATLQETWGRRIVGPVLHVEPVSASRSPAFIRRAEA